MNERPHQLAVFAVTCFYLVAGSVAVAVIGSRAGWRWGTAASTAVFVAYLVHIATMADPGR